MRWDFFDIDISVDWVYGFCKVVGVGDVFMKIGVGIYIYVVGCDMLLNMVMYLFDGEMFIVVQYGIMDVMIEFGNLFV